MNFNGFQSWLKNSYIEEIFFMAVDTYCYYKKVRRMMHTSVVSCLRNGIKENTNRNLSETSDQSMGINQNYY